MTMIKAKDIDSIRYQLKNAKLLNQKIATAYIQNTHLTTSPCYYMYFSLFQSHSNYIHNQYDIVNQM